MVHAITIEREFGCGASEIARFGRQPPWMESVGRTVDTGNRSTDREYARSGRAERMASRSCLYTGFSKTSFGAHLREACRPPTGCICSMRGGSPLFQKQLSRQHFPAVRR